jgi:beta-fructofuranosidase
MPFAKDGTFYLYYLKDNRNPVPFGEPFGWDLITTKDFVDFEDRGTVIPHGADDEQDQFIFSGSILEDRDGLFHAFYTGHNREFPKAGKPGEAIMHAQSGDLLSWAKTREALSLEPREGYEKNDWRDPFVLWDGEKERYMMLIGARKIQGKRILNGCTVYFESADLRHWDFKGPLWAPGCFAMHEMPDLFRMGEWWYLIISEYSDKIRMVYRMGKSPMGPWLAPPDDAFDGRFFYAARTFASQGRRYLFGWVPTREGNDDRGNSQWAGTQVVHELVQRQDNTLGLKVPDSVWNAFKTPRPVAPVDLRSVDASAQATVARSCGDLFRFEAELEFEEGTRSFALRVYENEETGEAYQFKFYVPENRFCFEVSPNQPYHQSMMGLERPLFLNPRQRYKLRMILDDTIATLYVDQTALNVRMYRKPGQGLAFAVSNGALKALNMAVASGLTPRTVP